MLGAPGAMSPNTVPATENDRPKFDTDLLKIGETSFAMCGRSEIVPRMIRAWNRQSATRHATEVTFRARRSHLFMKNTTFRAPAAFQISPSVAHATKSDTSTSLSTAPATKSDNYYYLTLLLLGSTITWQFLLLGSTTTWRFLSLDSTITWRFLLLDEFFHLTPLLFHSTITWRFLLLDSAVTWLCYVVRISEVSQAKLP